MARFQVVDRLGFDERDVAGVRIGVVEVAIAFDAPTRLRHRDADLVRQLAMLVRYVDGLDLALRCIHEAPILAAAGKLGETKSSRSWLTPQSRPSSTPARRLARSRSGSSEPNASCGLPQCPPTARPSPTPSGSSGTVTPRSCTASRTRQS